MKILLRIHRCTECHLHAGSGSKPIGCALERGDDIHCIFKWICWCNDWPKLWRWHGCATRDRSSSAAETRSASGGPRVERSAASDCRNRSHCGYRRRWRAGVVGGFHAYLHVGQRGRHVQQVFHQNLINFTQFDLGAGRYEHICGMKLNGSMSLANRLDVSWNGKCTSSMKWIQL